MELPVLTNWIGCYESMLRGEIRAEFKKEVGSWIDEAILIPWSGKVEGILPLMAVVQPTKKKVRSALNFQEFNKYIACHTRVGIDVCEEVMREWRRMARATKIMDLKPAYLQIHVDKKLWRYQLVEYKGQIYCLTRLRFGPSSAPKIMTTVLKTVLTKDNVVKRITSSHIDDILVEEAVVTAEKVRNYVTTYGLTAKPSESSENRMAGDWSYSRSWCLEEEMRSLKSWTAWPSEKFSRCAGCWLVITP